MTCILHIDTSGDEGTVMLAADGTVLSTLRTSDTRNYASIINKMIDDVLSAAGKSLADLAAVATCGGPGSYTGLRIGLATAKAICYTLDKPLLQHNKLELLSVEEYYKHLDIYDAYVTVLPARIQEYFVSVHDGKFAYIVEPQHVFEPELLKILGGLHGKILTKGILNKTILDFTNSYNIELIENQLVNIDSWASRTFETYNCNGFVNLSTAEPFYLKQVYTHK